MISTPGFRSLVMRFVLPKTKGLSSSGHSKFEFSISISKTSMPFLSDQGPSLTSTSCDYLCITVHIIFIVPRLFIPM
jgi:hypothetical protein